MHDGLELVHMKKSIDIYSYKRKSGGERRERKKGL